MEEFLKLFNLRDILLHIINTVILFVAIRFLVYKPVRKFLNARTERIATELSNAADMQKQAEQAMQNAQEERRSASADAAQTQAQGAQQAQKAGEEIVADAQKQADAIVRQARADAEQIKTAAREEIQAQALTMAVEIAEKMIGRELAEKDNAALAREFLTKVG